MSNVEIISLFLSYLTKQNLTVFDKLIDAYFLIKLEENWSSAGETDKNTIGRNVFSDYLLQ